MKGGASAPGNRLGAESSPFLQHGATQPVHWWAWGEEAFAHARQLDRPVLLDIGAVWCHWCHVMDRESYEDAETAALINELFVPIKVDRDERPDVDARYQRAVQVLTGQGGWPLTAFLTPAGDVFYAGTYFPPIDGQGRPSFRRVLSEVARVWDQDRDRAREAAQSVESRLEAYARAETQPGEANDRLVVDAVEELAGAFDFRYGGFGRAPKFPNAGALDLLLDRYHDTGAAWARRMVDETLAAMGRGGVFDQLGGGFHRYSTDARWIIPHFEKMAYDNGPLLHTYSAAAAALDDPYLAAIASGILDHYRDIAPDLVREGGFPASQDADFGADNDGDYWTWTKEEVRVALGDDSAFDAASLAFGLDDDAGAMHLDRSRHVLFRALDDDALAVALNTTVEDIRRRLDHVRSRLKAARDRRPRPFVDTSLYSGWTGLVASGHLSAARYLGREDAREAGLRALDRVWREAAVPDRGIVHRLADPESGEVLEDQAFVLLAALDAFDVTQEPVWLDRATLLAGTMMNRFRDPATGAFRDRPEGDAVVKALERPLLPIADAPTPSGNGAAALGLLRLAETTSAAEARAAGLAVLRAFAGSAARLLGSAATYLKAVTWAVSPVTVVVIVDDVESAGESPLFAAALRTYRPRTVVRLYRPSDLGTVALPPELEAMITAERPRAYVCAGRTCAAPVRETGSLAELLRTFRA